MWRWGREGGEGRGGEGRGGEGGRVEGACSKASVISLWQTSYFNVTLTHTNTLCPAPRRYYNNAIHISMLTMPIIITHNNLYIASGQITAKNLYTTQH